MRTVLSGAMKKYMLLGILGGAFLLFSSFSVPSLTGTRGSVSRKNAQIAWQSILRQLAKPGNYRSLGYAVKLARQEGVSLDDIKSIAKEMRCKQLEQAVKATKTIMQLAKDLALTEGECLQLALFIEAELDAVREEEGNYLSMKKTGLARSIEYDPKTKSIFIHLQGHGGVAPLGKGFKKIVTKSIQYDQERPQLLAHGTTKASIRHEVEALKKLEGLPGLMEFRAVTRRALADGSKEYSIMSKLYRHGTLEKFLKTNGHTLSLEDKLYMALDILTGIESMHEMQYVHRDINARNFLVDQIGQGERFGVVVCDFGRTRYVDDIAGKPAQGNSHYLAPEAYSFEHMTGSDYFYSDIYAVGSVLYQLVNGKRGPWARSDVVKKHRYQPEQAAEELCKRLKLFRDSRLSQLDSQVRYRAEIPLAERFERLILRMIDPQPHNRGTAKEHRQTIESILAQAHMAG